MSNDSQADNTENLIKAAKALLKGTKRFPTETLTQWPEWKAFVKAVELSSPDIQEEKVYIPVDYQTDLAVCHWDFAAWEWKLNEFVKEQVLSPKANS